MFSKLAARLLAATIIHSAIVVGLSIPHPARADESQNWAIISTNPATAAYADVLLARLSAVDGIRLVERDQIEKVFDELELSASGLSAG